MFRSRVYFQLLVCLFFIIKASEDVFAKTSSVKNSSFSQAISQVIRENEDIKLEHLRLSREKAKKSDAIVEFLPDVKANYQIGDKKDDALGTDRGVLDEERTHNVKSLEFTQPIFSGFKGYNKSKQINYDILVAEEYYKSRRDEILFNAITIYINLHKAKELLALTKKKEKQAQEIVSLSKRQNKLGKVSGSDVISNKIMSNNIAISKIEAEDNLLEVKQEYEKAIGKVNNNLNFPDIDTSLISSNEEQLINRAIKNNPTLRQYGFQVKSAKTIISQNKGEFLPKADLVASIQENANVPYLSGQDLRSEAIYLNVSIPLFQKGAEYSSLSQSYKALSFAQQEYRTNKKNLIKNVKQSYKKHLFYKDVLVSYQKSIALIRSQIKKSEEKIHFGRGELISLLNNKIELNNMLEKYLNYKAEYAINYYRLLILTGNLSKIGNV